MKRWQARTGRWTRREWNRQRTEIRQVPSPRRVRPSRRSNRSAWSRSLHARLDADAIVVADAGTPCPYFSAYYQVRGTGSGLFSNRAHGALGYSMAAAMGAHFAQPEVKCVSVMGDGSFGFTCGELETAARYRAADYFYCDFERELRLDQSGTKAQVTASAISPWISPLRITPPSLRRSASKAGASPSRANWVRH